MLGFGYALNIFYGPITTYFPILLSFFTKSCIFGLKIFTFLTVLLSGITMYNFIYQISKKKLIGLISALIYICAPYKLTNIYSRNAVGEYSAFIFIPMIFSGLHYLFHENKKKHYLLIIGAVGIILSHTISTIYVALFALIYILVNYKKLKEKEILKYILIDGALILLLTAFYLIPLIEHKIYGDYAIFDSDIMNTTGIDVWETGLGIKDFITSKSETKEATFSIGIVIAFGLCLTPFAYKKSKKNKEYIFFLALSILSLIMCTKLFPWLIMPKILTIVQFAWRLEGFFIFFVSYVCACNIAWLSEKLKDKKNIIGILTMISTVACAYWGTTKYIENNNFSEDNKFEEGIIKAEKIGPYQINREYMPINLTIDYIENREDGVYVIGGSAYISNISKEGLKCEFDVAGCKNAKLELPYVYYHGYTVWANGKKIKNFESENGFVAIRINESAHIAVKYTGTNIEKAGYVISGLTMMGIVIYILGRKIYLKNK